MPNDVSIAVLRRVCVAVVVSAAAACAAPVPPGPPPPAGAAAPAAPVGMAGLLGQPAPWYASGEAVRIAENVLLFQRSNGGWPPNQDMTVVLSDPERAALRSRKDGPGASIDNQATYPQIRFLARVHQATGEPRFRAGALAGIDYLLAAQYENGGWPQYWPVEGNENPRNSIHNPRDLAHFVTLNDDAMAGVAMLLLEVARGEEPFGFVGEERRARARQAVDRAADLLVDLQVVAGGRRSGWAAQYDNLTFEPRWGRKFEPVSLAGRESVGILRFLMQLEDPTPEVVEAIRSGVAWLDRARIEGVRVEVHPETMEVWNWDHTRLFTDRHDRMLVRDPGAPSLWARFYEIGTDRPVFASDDDITRYAHDEITPERRSGYDWYGDWPRALLEEEYPAWERRQGLSGDDRGESRRAASVTSVARPAAAGPEPAGPPNVLLIAVDDLNDWTGALGGHPNAQTPNIDALAARGVLFTNAHTQAPLCGPSRASFLTGLLPTTTGIYLHIDDRDVRDVNEATRATLSLPAYFASHGYRTMGFGKIWHGNDLAHTFEEYGEPHDWFGPTPPKRINYDPVHGPHYDGEAGTGTDWGAFPARDEEMSDHKYASAAIERLREEHDRPFLLAVGFVRPHVPWYVPQRWLDRHPLETVQLPPYRADDLDDVPEHGRRMAFMPPMPTTEYLRERNQWEEMVRAYLASTTWVDHQIGRVLAALAESRYADNTIVVLLSDHGYHLGEKGRVAKMSLWERDTRVPLIIAGPGVGSGMRSGRPVGLIDLYPTLLDLAGLPANPHNEGRSLTPLLADPDRPWPHPALTIFGPRNVSVRTEELRYTRYEDGSEEFYDHRSDPNEWRNLASDPARRAEVAAEIERLRAFIPADPAPLAEKSSFPANPYFRERMPVWRQRP